MTSPLELLYFRTPPLSYLVRFSALIAEHGEDPEILAVTLDVSAVAAASRK
ncbi:hypothetical protein [Actinobaculum sp. 313]|uniref:hypothetical protein n=1 Tax=Actinobaculum sp. 313 TaxID=2495645 RepID=UPI0013DE3C6B|nr:hypothetical protein [Actinobaculum sp. 313]